MLDDVYALPQQKLKFAIFFPLLCIVYFPLPLMSMDIVPVTVPHFNTLNNPVIYIYRSIYKSNHIQFSQCLLQSDKYDIKIAITKFVNLIVLISILFFEQILKKVEKTFECKCYISQNAQPIRRQLTNIGMHFEIGDNHV